MTTSSGSGPGSGSRTPRPPAPPKYRLELNPRITNSRVELRIRTIKDSAPEALNIIIFKDGIQVAALCTGGDGFYNFSDDYTVTDKEQKIAFEVVFRDFAEKAFVEIVIPAATAAAKKDDDPQKIVLIRTHDGAGNFGVFIRVTKVKGYGIATNVTILFRGVIETGTTDADGIAFFDVPGIIAPGENWPLVATVSGIDNIAKVKIKRLQPRIGGPARFKAGWFFGTNNGRAFILMCLVVLFWLSAFIIGIGQPLIHGKMFRDKDGLSKQEQTYQRVMKQAYSVSEGAPKVAPTESRGHWHHWIWKIAVVLTLIFVIYGPLSLREEIAEEISIAVERLKDRDYAQAGDPWFERLVAWTGAYAVAKAPAATITTTTPGDAAPVAHKETMWSSFPVHLASDAITELIPAMFRAIFK